MLQQELSSHQQAVMASLDLLLRCCSLPHHVHQVAVHKLSTMKGRKTGHLNADVKKLCCAGGV